MAVELVSLVSKLVARVGVVLDEQVVPAPVAVLGGGEWRSAAGRDGLTAATSPWMARDWVNASPSPKTPVAAM